MTAGWTTAALGEVATLDRSGVSPEDIAHGTTYVGLEHITSGGSFVDVQPVDRGELSSQKFRFSAEHVLYGKLRPYLSKIACPDFSGVCSTEIIPILPGPRVDRRYLLHFLRLPEQVAKATALSSGANLPRISPKVLAGLPLPLPPLPEQRRIAAILDKADELRAKRRASLALLDSLTKSVMQQLLTEGFERTLFGELIADGPKNGLYRPASDYGSGAPIVRIDSFNLGSSHIAVDSLKRLRASAKEVSEFGLAPGDLVVNRVNSREFVGKTGLVREIPEPTVFESNMMRIRVDPDRLLPVYAAEFMQTSDARRQVGSMMKDAVNQSSINQADVRSLRIPLPPLEVQRDFETRIEAIGKHRTAVLNASAIVDSLFACLQSRAFRGEL